MENKDLFEALNEALGNLWEQEVTDGDAAGLSEANQEYTRLSNIVIEKELWPEFNDWLNGLD